MKINEQFINGEGSTFHVKKTYDPTPTLDRVKALKSAGVQDMGEGKHVGTVPGWLIVEWCKEAGVSYSDANARNEIIRKKLMSGDFSALRNWEGSF